MDYFIISLLFIPVLIFTIIASIKVKTTFKKYDKVKSAKGLTGAQAELRVLYTNGITDVIIRQIPGNLTDHYNPADNSLNLSPEVYNGTSVSAIGVACHEAGHAMQYAHAYLPIKIRAAIIPVTNFGARFSGIMIMGGLLLASFGFTPLFFLAEIGLLLFGFTTLFQLITLPTEFNASRRAIACIKESNILVPSEIKGAKNVLSAAAMTYVAALAVSLLELLRLISIVKGRD